MADVVLRTYTEADRWLADALEGDPGVMAELGGPRAPEAIARAHGRRLHEPWWFVIADAADGEALGTIGIWASEHDGLPVHETGWTLLPAAQGRGVASAALQELLRRARQDGGFRRLYAFPAVTNGASQRLCDKAGFDRGAEVEFAFGDATLHCVVRTLDL